MKELPQLLIEEVERREKLSRAVQTIYENTLRQAPSVYQAGVITLCESVLTEQQVAEAKANQ
jgi:hypothetical protein